MKTKMLFFRNALCVACISLFICQCAKAQDKNSDDELILAMLKKFYTIYISENSRISSDEMKISALKKKYCSADLLDRIRKEELDYDPFVYAQDCNVEWLKTLTVGKGLGENEFNVTYIDNYSNQKIVLNIIVVEGKDGYKIKSVVH